MVLHLAVPLPVVLLLEVMKLVGTVLGRATAPLVVVTPMHTGAMDPSQGASMNVVVVSTVLAHLLVDPAPAQLPPRPAVTGV